MMGIWLADYTIEQVNQLNRNTMVEHLEIEFTEKIA